MVRMTALLLPVLVLGFAVPAEAKTIHVHKGQSIQAAVDRAKPGDRILVGPGVYREEGKPCPAASAQTCAVAIQKNGIKLIGGEQKASGRAAVHARGRAPGSRWRRSPAVATASRTRPSGVHGSLISGLTVRGFDDFGVFLLCVDHWRITARRARSTTGSTALPVAHPRSAGSTTRSPAARTTPATTSGSRSTRGWTTTSRRTTSAASSSRTARGSAPTTTSRSATPAGSSPSTLPFLDVKVEHRQRIDHNRVFQEQQEEHLRRPRGHGLRRAAGHRNPAAGDRRQPGRVQQGDRQRLLRDRGGELSASRWNCRKTDCAALDIEPNPDGNRVIGNTAKQNGKNPDPSVPSVFTVDLAWDTDRHRQLLVGQQGRNDLPLTAAGLPIGSGALGASGASRTTPIVGSPLMRVRLLLASVLGLLGRAQAVAHRASSASTARVVENARLGAPAQGAAREVACLGHG